MPNQTVKHFVPNSEQMALMPEISGNEVKVQKKMVWMIALIVVMIDEDTDLLLQIARYVA